MDGTQKMGVLTSEMAAGAGIVIRDLVTHGDSRGALYELYRGGWTASPPFEQWNVVRSDPHVLRGVHVHPNNCDYLHVLDGNLLLGVHDLRPENPGDRLSGFIEITGNAPRTVYVPNGVCHGFYFNTPTTYVYGLSHGWSMEEELGCHFTDPGLGLDWPVQDPILSDRDTAPQHDYASMRDAWISAQGDTE